MDYNRVTIICGHYGAGKTSFSINYSLYIRSLTEEPIYIADLDVVNPYFRSREHAEYLENDNIKVIGSYLPQSGSDLPAVSAEVYSIFNRKDIVGIIDMGGNFVGSLPFATFRDKVDINETDVLFVLNANRKENSTFDYALGHLISIENALGLKITGIINNTHLMYDTSMEDVNIGENIASEISKEINVPVKFTCVSRDFLNKNGGVDSKYRLFIMDYDIKSIGNVI
ncbi:hypothetical protein [Brachyspira alvinipulli]|uniref:hypothetical protein n=1 Tax=Brachyspira alvinipulli TaxID=84379 RepID=UPI000489F788|nr:hypothetical protein [Brachyspira alvinipulli]